MPYITQEHRNRFDKFIEGAKINNPGELNYVFYKLALKYLEHNENYQAYNDIFGVFSCCSMELYRRKCVLYEEEKIKQNGDI